MGDFARRGRHRLRRFDGDFDLFDKACGDSADDGAWGKAAGNNSVGADHAVVAEGDAFEDRAPFAEPAVVFNNDGGNYEFSGLPRHGVVVVGDIDASGDKDILFDSDELCGGAMKVKVDVDRFGDLNFAEFAVVMKAFETSTGTDGGAPIDADSFRVKKEIRFVERRAAGEPLEAALPAEVGEKIEEAFHVHIQLDSSRLCFEELLPNDGPEPATGDEDDGGE